MKIVAIDSSGLVASVAIVEEAVLIAEYTIQYKKTHSQTLLPMLNTIKEMIDLDVTTIDAIAVAKGPGSFTGLRIGSATAKGLALAWGKPIVAVPTIDAMAYNLYGTDKLICPIMDARRGQVYTALYEFSGDKEYRLNILEEQCAVMLEEIIEKIHQTKREVIFLGDGVPVFASRLQEELKVPYMLAPAHMNRQRAAALAVLAQEYIKAGKIETAAEHKPDYLRMSQAERERLEKKQ